MQTLAIMRTRAIPDSDLSRILVELTAMVAGAAIQLSILVDLEAQIWWSEPVCGDIDFILALEGVGYVSAFCLPLPLAALSVRQVLTNLSLL